MNTLFIHLHFCVQHYFAAIRSSDIGKRILYMSHLRFQHVYMCYVERWYCRLLSITIFSQK